MKHSQVKKLKNKDENNNSALFSEEGSIPSLPPYTTRDFIAILEAYHIPWGPNQVLSKDNHRDFHLYAYQPQTLSIDLLMQDNINYFLKHLKTAGDRRVCFLLFGTDQSIVALIVQLAGFNIANATRLQKKIRHKNLTTVQEVAEDLKLKKRFKNLYSTIHMLVLGSAQRPELVHQLYVLMEYAYSGRITLDFKAPATINPSIILLEDCIAMLKEGKTHVISSEQAFSGHRQQCIRALIDSFDRHKEIISALTIILKYLQLQQARTRRYGIHGTTLTDLEELLACDKKAKRVIYENLQANLEEILLNFQLNFLIPIISLRNNSQDLLRQLQHIQLDIYQSLKGWEQEIQNHIIQQKQSWILYFKYQLRKIVSFVYQYSFIQLGVELVSWAGLSLEKFIPAVWIDISKEAIQQGVERAILLCRLSPALACRGRETIGRSLNNRNLTYGLKTLGAVTGLSSTYFAGSYAIFRMLLISILALQLQQRFQEADLDDKKAAVIQKKVFKLSASFYLHALNLGLCALEALYQRNLQRLLSAFGGVGCSQVLVASAQRFIPALRADSHQQLTNNQIFMLLLFSFVGYHFGSTLMSASYEEILSFLSHSQTREQFISMLRNFETQNNLLDLSIENEHSTWFTSLHRWLKQENKIAFEWRQHRFFYHADCFVQNLGTNIEIQCDTRALPARLMG